MTVDQEFVLLVNQSSPWGQRAIVERTVIPTTSSTGLPAGYTSMAIQVTLCDKLLEPAEVMAMDLVPSFAPPTSHYCHHYSRTQRNVGNIALRIDLYC
jgi:hypothetical protein